MLSVHDKRKRKGSSCNSLIGFVSADHNEEHHVKQSKGNEYKIFRDKNIKNSGQGCLELRLDYLTP